jgi:hypothetical protein
MADASPSVALAGIADDFARCAAVACDIAGLQSAGGKFAELAKREKLNRSYYSRVVRLTYLAPDITRAILEGRQPPGLSAARLLEHSGLPLAWPEQRKALGFT